MESAELQVQTLGVFSIRQGDAALTVSGRSRKLCLLLAFLICERSRALSYEELIGLLWNGETPGPNPLNALKAILHRARTCLDQLFPGAGRALILSREGGCQWNEDFPLVLDTERFLLLCRKAGRSRKESRQLALRMEALDLYRGDFLPALTGCPWAEARKQQLHQLYLQTVLDVLPALTEQGRWQDALQAAQAAFDLEPCREDLCRWQMECLLRLDRRWDAAQLYESLQDRLLAQLGVMPSDQLRELYREVNSGQDPRAISPVTLLERLQEPPQAGALLCSYDFFRVICHAVARQAGRSGEPVHVALISLTGPEGSTLVRYSLDRAMDNLQGIIPGQLRRGDAATRCSASQFILLLPQASYENSRLVCSRIVKAFIRQYPHSPASIQVSVQPLLTET